MRSAYVIFPSLPHPWSLARISAGRCQLATLEEVSGMTCPQALMPQLRKLGYHGEGAILALPSRLCLCASIDETGLRRSSRLATLQFRLEARLPLAMEEMAADFISGVGQALGVAVHVPTVKPLVAALEGQGIAIAGICPAALLLAEQIAHESRQKGKIDLILCGLDGQVDLLEIEGTRTVVWTLLPPQAAAVQLHLNQILLHRSEALRVCAVGIAPEIQSCLTASGRVETIAIPSENPLELAARAAGRIALGKTASPVELRRGPLAGDDPLRQVRTPLRAALAAAVLLFVTLAVAMLWRLTQFDRLAQAAHARQVAAFRVALPSQTLPPSLTSRLLSEEKRLEGLSGTDSVLPPPLSVLPLLQETLAALPQDLRFRLLELRFEPRQLYMEGQTLDHGSADQIAAALRQGISLRVDPPHTEQPSGEDVTFTISASASSPSSSAASDTRGNNP